MIRRATSADQDRLRAIQTVTLDEPWPELLDVAIEGAPLVLVVDEGTGPLAYTLVVPDYPVAYVAELAVAPAVQGNGYGTRLLEELFDRLRRGEFETVRLTARADDERVRSFYDDAGFDLVESLPAHYDDGDGVLLSRDL